MRDFIVGRLKSIKYALKGFYLLITTEDSILAQSILFLLIVLLGFYVDLDSQGWINQTIVMGMILCTEGVNTAIEKLADFIHIKHHPKIGVIKDISAGAVTISFITFVVVLAITYYPYFLS